MQGFTGSDKIYVTPYKHCHSSSQPWLLGPTSYSLSQCLDGDKFLTFYRESFLPFLIYFVALIFIWMATKVFHRSTYVYILCIIFYVACMADKPTNWTPTLGRTTWYCSVAYCAAFCRPPPSISVYLGFSINCVSEACSIFATLPLPHLSIKC